MKKYIFGLLAVFALLFAVPSAQADVAITGYSYSQTTQSFTITVATTEPWVVWWKADLMSPWVQASKVLGVGKKSWTDTGIGSIFDMGFYTALPKGKHPDNGNHFGWSQERNPHNVD